MATIDLRGASLSAADPPIGTNPNPDLAIKAPVRVATTGSNINLQTIGLGTIDGVALAAGDRVLVKDQTDATTNGLYNASTGPWTRTIDANNNSQFAQGTQITVAAGTLNVNTEWAVSAANPITLGTTALTFAGIAPVGANTVTNAKLAQMPAKTFKANSTAGSANAADITGDTAESLLLFTQSGSGATQRTLDSKIKDFAVSVIDFGADPTGVADSATAINNAIASLPVTGGDVLFPVGAYKIGSTINIGNGSSSAASTRYGVRLIGLGQPIWVPAYAGYPTTPNVKLLWAGSVGGTIIQVNGPLQGWGIQNFFLDGNTVNSAANGIVVTSGQSGDSANLSFQNCTSSDIEVTTLTSSSGPALATTVSQFNSWRNLSMIVAGTAQAKGIFLTGQGTTADTDFNKFDNISVVLSTAINYGIYLQGCDSNKFSDVDIIGTGNASSFGVIFDYSLASALPSDNIFDGINVTISSGTAIGNTGSPGASARPNRVKGLTLVNGLAIPSVPNLAFDLPDTRVIVNLIGQTAQINQTLYTPLYRGLLRINYYLVITTVGTGGSISGKFFWTDKSGIQQSVTSASASTTVLGAFASGTIIADADPAGVVTEQVNFSAVTGSPQYTWVVTIERLD